MIFENLYSALEESSCSVPKGLHFEFVRLGFRCLPLNVFVQYVNRGIFVLDDVNAEEISNQLSKGPFDFAKKEIRYHLISKFPNQEKSIEYLKKDPLTAHNLAEFLVSFSALKFGTSVASTPETVRISSPVLTGSGYSQQRDSIAENMESEDGSPFIPLSVFLHSIKDESLDVNFIKKTKEKSIESTFQLSFNHRNNSNTSSHDNLSQNLSSLSISSLEEISLNHPKNSPPPKSMESSPKSPGNSYYGTPISKHFLSEVENTNSFNETASINAPSLSTSYV